MTTLELNDTDCALIIEKDMVLKLILPTMEEDALIDQNDSPNVFYTTALASLVGNSEELQEMVEDRVQEIIDDATSDDGCTCGGNCGEECECKNG
jgi:hypothetical protein